MLLRFAVSNYRSFKEEQELLLTAVSALKEDREILIEPDAPSVNENVLPVALIYGPNASGKSNLVRAYQFMKGAILFSHEKRQRIGDARIPRHAHKLDPEWVDRPGTFDIEFVAGHVRYHYGFEATDGEFLREWLYAYPEGRQRRLFERENGEIEFGRNLTGRNRALWERTREDSLFLSVAAQNNHKILRPVADFLSALPVIGAREHRSPFFGRRLKEPDSRTMAFLKQADTGIVDFRLDTKKIPPEDIKFRHALIMALRSVGEEVEEEEDADEFQILQLAHRGREGRKVFFDIEDESDGTLRLLDILDPVFATLEKGTTIVIDELGASLHTHAAAAIIRLFLSKETNPRGAQLVATTHDTNLLNTEGVRRDMIWLVEKDEEGASHLYPLTDFRTRKEWNIERGYLQGRFGAIPFAGDFEQLMGDERWGVADGAG